MGTQVYLSSEGTSVAGAEARVSVFDRGFLYGDSVFETMRTAGGVPVELARHLARLRRSAAGIGLEVPWADTHIESVIAQTHEAAGNPESYVRVIVTRGVGPLMLDPRRSEDPSLVVIVQPLEVPSEIAYARGISAIILGGGKTQTSGLDPTIKSGNYLASILALRQAIRQGGDDAILCNADGDIAEGASSNVFYVRAGHLFTPHLATGLLPGITREVVCELAGAAGHPVREIRVAPEDLRQAQEVFLTSSVRGIMPVTKVDGRVIGAGEAGPMTRELQGHYRDYLAAATRLGREGAGG